MAVNNNRQQIYVPEAARPMWEKAEAVAKGEPEVVGERAEDFRARWGSLSAFVGAAIAEKLNRLGIAVEEATP